MRESISAADSGSPGRFEDDPRLEHARFAQILLVLVFLGLTGIWGARGPALTGDSPPRIGALRTGVDPNEAAWYELAQLPGVGETLAGRIVEYRNAESNRRGDGPVFSRPSDLTRVRGIGGKTVRRLSAFLNLDDRGASPIVDRSGDGR